jgi:hypothetical protein
MSRSRARPSCRASRSGLTARPAGGPSWSSFRAPCQTGNLYISLYNPNIIYRLSPDGTLATLYDDWEQLMLIAPTNIAFGGPDMRTLIIASLCGWSVHVATVDVPGFGLRYPKI